MRNVIVTSAFLSLVLISACKGPLFSSTDESLIRETILESINDELISPAKGQALLEILDEVQSPQNWEAWVAGVIGLVGAYFGVRSRREIAARGPAKPISESDIQILHDMLNKAKAERG